MARTYVASHPCPEIVAPGAAFTIEATAADHIAHTSRDSRCFAVPYAGNPAGVRAVRAHELGHLRFSPGKASAKRYKVSQEALLAAEDGRVNQLLAAAGIDLNALAVPEASIETVDVNNPLLLFNLAATVVARLGTGACSQATRAWVQRVAPDDMLVIIRGTVSRAAQLFRGRNGRNGLTWRTSVKVARLLDSLRPPPRKVKPGGAPDLSPDEAGQGWGTMAIETPPLSKSVLSCLRQRTSTSEGDIPTQIHRLTSDGAIFTTTRTRRTASILVDCSGSMGWDDKQLAATLALCSGATIALYSGKGNDTGTLRLVARNGRMVADPALLDLPGGLNIIDGPALAWLGRQSGPRLWVSDGKVTGLGERRTPGLTATALHLCQAHAIKRVMPGDELTQALRRL